jgi:uncharacterized protein (TIGR02145 family)
MLKYTTFSFFLFFLFFSFSQDTIINNQSWATKNLNTKIFKNGDSILYARTNKEWVDCHSNGIPAYCYYDNDPKNGETYGAIYNWFAMADPRGIAPEGSRVANDLDWVYLYSFLKIGVINYPNKGIAGIKLKSTYSWSNHGNGEDAYGMSILPGGLRLLNGSFQGIGDCISLWSRDSTYSYTYSAASESNYIYFQSNEIDMLFKNENSRTGHYIRCIKGDDEDKKIATAPLKTQDEIDMEIMSTNPYNKKKKKKKKN